MVFLRVHKCPCIYRVVLVTFLLRVSCTVWPRVSDVKTWRKSGVESTAWPGCDKADGQADGRESRAGLAEQKGLWRVSLWQEGVFLDYSEDSLPPLPQCWALLWTAAGELLEIKHINYLRYPLAPFFPGAWWASHWVGESFCLVWVIWWQKADCMSLIWRQLCAVMSSWEGSEWWLLLTSLQSHPSTENIWNRAANFPVPSILCQEAETQWRSHVSTLKRIIHSENLGRLIWSFFLCGAKFAWQAGHPP